MFLGILNFFCATIIIYTYILRYIMYIDVNLIISEHKLSPQPIPFRLLGQPRRGKGARPSGPVSLASPLFGTEMPEPDASSPDRDSVSSCSLSFLNPQSLIFSLFSFSS
jgi:hypothetical protein